MNVDAILGFADIAVKSTISKINLRSLAQLRVSNEQNVVFITYLGQ
jgi:hypothetical protein